jgi:hypothetical protein
MSTHDQEVIALINEVTKRKAEIAQLGKIDWKTNCTFSFMETKLVDVVNIHVEKSIKALVGIVGFLLSAEKAHNDAVSKLEIEAPAFKWSGYTVEEWVSDIKNRINQIEVSSKKAKLEALETRLDSIVSPELRQELELKAIKESLGV